MKRREPSIALTLLFIVALPFAAAAQSRQDRNRAKVLQDQADKAVREKNYRDASDKYSQALVLVADNPYAHFWKGTANWYLWQDGERRLTNLQTQRRQETNATRQQNLSGQIEQQRKENDQAVQLALNELNIALSQGFRPLEVYRIRAYIFYEQKNYDAALVEIRKGVALAPKDLPFLKSLAEVHLARNAYADALTALRNAAQVAPNDADIHYNLARVHFALRDTKAQQSAAETALAKGTRFVGETHYLLGDAHRKLRNPAGAIDALQKAVNAKPDLYQAYRDLGDVFRSENRFTDAINITKKGILAFPGDGNLYTDISWFYSLAGRAEEAVQAAKDAIGILPNQYVAYTNLCRAYNETRQHDLAVTACNTALRLQPNDGETYFYLGNANVALGRSVEANRLYSRAVTGLVDYTQKNPEYSDGWYLLGNAYFADRQIDKAIESYLKCLALSPKFLKARVNLGISYTRAKNRAAATQQYDIVLRTDPALAAILKGEIDKM
jgi:tetratricopeptide (TPR) repeat protein